MINPYSSEEEFDVSPPYLSSSMVFGCLVKLLWLCLFFIIVSILGAGIVIGMVFAPYFQ